MVAYVFRIGLCLIGAAFAAPAAWGDHLLPPADPELLVLSVPQEAAPRVDLVMTRATLDALPQVSFSSRNLWSVEEHSYSGPSLQSVIEAAGVPRARRVIARSITDYRFTLPGEDIWAEMPIIATRIDGDVFGLRKGGPFWIVYPYDTASQHTAHDLVAGNVGQLIELKIEPE